ncbi:MAG: fatty-acyl-CoA synthase [Ilumatobacter sp.]|jgi:fatty-acyl-CoA synthase
MMYTSGTTGRPKGAIITHGTGLLNTMPCRVLHAQHNRREPRPLPLFHIAGLNTFADPVCHFGGTNIVMSDFDLGACLELLGDEEVGVTHFLGVPTNYVFMSQHPSFETATLPTVVAAALGGAPSLLPLLEAWGAEGLALQQGDGLTETSPIGTALKPEDTLKKIGSAGLAALHTEVRVVNADGNDVVPGEIGEIWTRGPNVTPVTGSTPRQTKRASSTATSRPATLPGSARRDTSVSSIVGKTSISRVARTCTRPRSKP